MGVAGHPRDCAMSRVWPGRSRRGWGHPVLSSRISWRRPLHRSSRRPPAPAKTLRPRLSLLRDKRMLLRRPRSGTWVERGTGGSGPGLGSPWFGTQRRPRPTQGMAPAQWRLRRSRACQERLVWHPTARMTQRARSQIQGTAAWPRAPEIRRGMPARRARLQRRARTGGCSCCESRGRIGTLSWWSGNS